MHHHQTTSTRALIARAAMLANGLLLTGSAAFGAVDTVPTTSGGALANALHPAGLTIKSVQVHNGAEGQIGTFSNFNLPPVTIQSGVVLSSGSVANLGPIPEASLPDYDPSSPPAQVNSQMVFDPETGATAEFDNYGLTAGNIENFYGCYDVAAIEVTFTLEDAAQVKFDFVFGSVEYPF